MILIMGHKKMTPAKISLIAMDVDGVLTDGGIIIGSNGFEAKMFNARDGLGLSILMNLGYQVAWVTGRRSDIVERRANELHIPHLMQGITNKIQAIEELLAKLNLNWENVMYIGDDLNDLGPLQKAALTCTVNNACPEVKQQADYIAKAVGGAGAVREIIELFLKHERRWPEALELYLKPDHFGRKSSKGEIQ
jgi:3-deoxy-D-manno-octulosonate 8-phosphate phosphatase (KDO 8-P phosphatase)